MLFLGFFFLFFGAVTLLFFAWRGYLALVFRCWCRYLALSVCAVSLLFSNTSLQHSHTNGSEKNLLTPKSIRGNTLRGETQFRGVKVWKEELIQTENTEECRKKKNFRTRRKKREKNTHTHTHDVLFTMLCACYVGFSLEQVVERKREHKYKEKQNTKHKEPKRNQSSSCVLRSLCSVVFSCRLAPLFSFLLLPFSSSFLASFSLQEARFRFHHEFVNCRMHYVYLFLS